MKKLFRSPIARGVMIYAVLPNLALYLIGREYAIARPQVNIDYLLLWIGSCYLSRRATILLYALLFGVDLVLSTESIYHYSTLELIAVSREILDFDPPVAYGLTGSLILILVMASIRAFRSIHVRRHVSRQRHLLAGTAAVVFLWFGNQQSMQDRANPIWESFANHSIVGSGVVEAGIAGFELVSQSQEDLYVTPAANTATAGMVHDFMTRQGPFDSYNVVVILVESQGLLNDAGDMRRVLKPLTDERIRARYIVNTGAVQFIGATMFGELRTLCRIYVPNATPSNLPELNQCLPNQLARRGFETVSYHGYHRWMYTREHWYPVLGFQRSYFLEDLLPLAPPSAKCGLGFQTLCDLWLADQVEHDLLASRARRKFLYWLTVNSHYPINTELASQSSFDCARTESLRDASDPCDLERIHFQLYERIAKMALNPALRPTRFFIVGDHSPPFPELSKRALYDENRVPFLELIPISTPPGDRLLERPS